MTYRSWKNIIFFKTKCSLSEDNINQIKLFIKYPRSDFRQKIKLIDSTPSPVNRELISKGSHELFTYNLTSLSEKPEILTRFEIKIFSKIYRISRSPFPYIVEKDFLEYYLKSTPLVEADNEEIQEIAENITALCKKFPEALERIIGYISRNYVSDPEYLEIRQSSTDILDTRKGNCEDINHLFNAICRSINIPSRLVLGFSKSNSEWGRHAWSEIYDPQYGWFPIDLLYKNPQVAALDASHLKLLTALDSSESEIRVEYEYPHDKSYPKIILDHILFIDKSAVPAHIEIKPKLE
ncbi:MAG: hypothetical protein GF329_14830 [Candidatus Lokiarchaeota archaeon]|nr:hypothetical protein [Candidatus Lokiarchaeota archaeon]